MSYVLGKVATAALCVALVGAIGVADGKEYNKRMHLAPEQRAKVDRTIAKSRALQGQQAPGSGDVTNVGCGGINVGNVQAGRPGQTPRDNVVVITGDVINVSKGCRKGAGAR